MKSCSDGLAYFFEEYFVEIHHSSSNFCSLIGQGFKASHFLSYFLEKNVFLTICHIANCFFYKNQNDITYKKRLKVSFS